jgi:hypothetical protein
LFKVKIEVLRVRVVIRMREPHMADSLFDQTSCEQTMPAEVVLAVTFVIFLRLLSSGRRPSRSRISSSACSYDCV